MSHGPANLADGKPPVRRGGGFLAPALLPLLFLASALTAGELASPWQTVAHMPADNHDITAAVVGAKLYVAGGATNDFKGTGEFHAFDEIWELDPGSWAWCAVAKFSRPRIYCATAAFAERVWVVGGDVLHEDNRRRASALVEIFDPRTGELTRAPDLPVALPNPLALAAAGRLWVLGARDRTERAQFASIGPGETAWRVEPAALPKMWALAGAALDDRLYVCVPDTGLAVFDPATRAWSVIPGPTQPRSAQVAAWRGELWIMGGVDIAERTATHIYHPAQRTWRRGPDLPTPLAWGAAAVVHDQLVVTGGSWLSGPPEKRKYIYTDRTLALAAIPPVVGTAFPRWSDEKLRGTGGAGLPFATERVFPGLKLQRPVTIMAVPVKNFAEPERLLVIESDGPVSTFLHRPDIRQRDPLLDLPAHFRQATQTYGLAFHPQFPAVPHVYIVYNTQRPKPAENVLARFTVTQFDPPRADPASELVLLRWPSDGHNAGDVKFGPDAFLYVSTGDGGPPGDTRNVGQRVDIITGGVLRLDVEHRENGRNYAVPGDNPFVGLPDVRPEYWAYGLRNPWRMSFAPTGELWLGDNGDDSWESIHLIRKGRNYGWSVFEGSHPFKRTLALGGPNPQATRPVIELPHSEARSVIGGLVYRGQNLPGLAGHYLFGDYVTGLLWAFQWDGAAAKDFRRIAHTRGRPIGFGEDRAREVLLVRLDGEIHHLVAVAPQPKAAEFPLRLSETGLFASTSAPLLAPAAGVVPYVINAPLWSDSATAARFIALPGTRSIAFSENQAWQLPVGSAVVRTLELALATGPRRIETQVMHRAGDTWQFYTYAWNAAQTDADLVSEAGETRDPPGFPDRRWRFSGRAECGICHTAQTNFTLGLSTAQLNRPTDLSALGGAVGNQLHALATMGVLAGLPASPPEQLPRSVNPRDPTAPLEARARAYLSANCAHCHRPDGVGGRAAFQLPESLPLAQTGLVNGQPLVPLLGSAAKLVVPGDPARSEVLHRLTLKEGGRMPLLGSEQTDDEGVELIRQWILQLKP
jgi:uncharacterized repeat protein (TIGR03806 family)